MKRLIIRLLKFYKKHISPSLPSQCIFQPTCSVYAMEAVERHGACKGSLLALWRLLRCNPFNKGGFDPVPENYKGKAKWLL